jgi:hypothetical protein
MRPSACRQASSDRPSHTLARHEFRRGGFRLSSDDTVGRLLKQQGYTLQRTQKTEEGAQHPDRDAQFRYVNEQVKTHLAAGQPVVSVDTKKRDLVGRYANGGAEWQPAGELERVGVHDFPDPKVGKAIPYGVWRFCLKSAGRRRCAYRLSFARTYAISTAGCTLSSKVPEPPRGAPNLSPSPIPNRLGTRGHSGGTSWSVRTGVRPRGCRGGSQRRERAAPGRRSARCEEARSIGRLVAATGWLHARGFATSRDRRRST